MFTFLARYQAAGIASSVSCKLFTWLVATVTQSAHWLCECLFLNYNTSSGQAAIHSSLPARVFCARFASSSPVPCACEPSAFMASHRNWNEQNNLETEVEQIQIAAVPLRFTFKLFSYLLQTYHVQVAAPPPRSSGSDSLSILFVVVVIIVFIAQCLERRSKTHLPI